MRNLVFLSVFLCIFSQTIFASVSVSTDRDSFCTDRKDPNYVKELISDEDNWIGFSNYGGLLYGGVCWWHSRLLRNSIYLNMYRPELPIPTEREATEILKAIQSGRYVVEIPGFKNFHDFTRHFDNQTQRILNGWQMSDGFLKQKWIKGLSSGSHIKADKLAQKMDDLYEYVVNKNNIAYQMLQMPGVVSHAWLVIDMKKNPNGYDLFVADSNEYRVEKYVYRYGNEYLFYPGFGEFVPYLQETKELKKINKTIKKYCAGKKGVFNVKKYLENLNKDLGGKN